MQPANTGVVFVLLACLACCDAPLRPETPPILEGARIGDEEFELCPGQNPEFPHRISRSPEFEARLKELVSIDSAEQALIKALAGQGFRMEDPPCANDPAVRSAMFTQSGGGFTSYPVLATAYWRVNADSGIEWIHGNVAFTGP